MNEPPRPKPGIELSDEEIGQHSSLFHMTKAEAFEVISTSLHEFRIYCRKNDLDFLNYLIEMAVLETMEIQMSLQNDTNRTRS